MSKRKSKSKLELWQLLDKVSAHRAACMRQLTMRDRELQDAKRDYSASQEALRNSQATVDQLVEVGNNLREELKVQPGYMSYGNQRYEEGFGDGSKFADGTRDDAQRAPQVSSQWFHHDGVPYDIPEPIIHLLNERLQENNRLYGLADRMREERDKLYKLTQEQQGELTASNEAMQHLTGDCVGYFVRGECYALPLPVTTRIEELKAEVHNGTVERDTLLGYVSTLESRLRTEAEAFGESRVEIAELRDVHAKVIEEREAYKKRLESSEMQLNEAIVVDTRELQNSAHRYDMIKAQLREVCKHHGVTVAE